MIVLVEGVIATPSKNVGYGFKSMVLELFNSTSRNECTLEKHSSFHNTNLAFTSCHLYILQLSPKLLKIHTYYYEFFEQTYMRKFKICVCLQLREIIHVSCMKSSVLAMQCCTLCYSIMSHTTLILLPSCIHVNTTKFLDITCTLIATKHDIPEVRVCNP